VAAHQQVGAFIATKVNGTLVKQGGNVASYFCTPEGRVIHAVIGPVNADELLKEANWALAAWDKAKQESDQEDREYEVSLAHRGELPQAIPINQGGPAHGRKNISADAWGNLSQLVGTQPQKVHQLLAARPLAPLAEVYVEVFERILGEQVSTAPNVELAEQGLQHAENEGRPMLFVLHHDQDNARFAAQWMAFVTAQQKNNPTLRTLLRYCVIIVLPQKELPALSSRLKQEPYSVPSLGTPQFVITNSLGKQCDSLAGYEAVNQLNLPLAKALVAETKLTPPQNLTKLKDIWVLIRRVDPNLAAELQPVIEEVTANQRNARYAKNEP
jgi:hypothetical protein